MKKYNKCIGNYGEDLACSFLKNLGYTILDRNFRTRYGEIDIICSYKDIIIFLEIKSRYTNNYGLPIESVTYSKQKQIIKLSKSYIHLKNLYNFNIRYDIISIIFSNKDNSYKLSHLCDAFRIYL